MIRNSNSNNNNIGNKMENIVTQELLANGEFIKASATIASMVAETHARHNARAGLNEDAVKRIVNERLDDFDLSLDQDERIREIINDHEVDLEAMIEQELDRRNLITEDDLSEFASKEDVLEEGEVRDIATDVANDVAADAATTAVDEHDFYQILCDNDVVFADSLDEYVTEDDLNDKVRDIVEETTDELVESAIEKQLFWFLSKVMDKCYPEERERQNAHLKVTAVNAYKAEQAEKKDETEKELASLKDSIGQYQMEIERLKAKVEEVAS